MSGMAQTHLQLDHSISSLTILGTSTIHDWEISVNEFDGSMNASLSGSSSEILNGTLVASVSSFKSYKKSMDKVVFDAMKEREFPKLTFRFVETDRTYVKGGNTYKVVKGKLTIAGTTRDIDLHLLLEETGKGLTLKGKKTFKMTDFNISPPTAMFGTIKSGDEITIDFDISFS